LPPGVLNIVNGFGAEAGQALASSKRIAKIAFTGSTPVGSKILQCAAENIIPSTVELGGKSPNIFFEDIMNHEDEFLSKCVEGTVLAFFNQGEVCTCPSRALIQASIYDEFIALVIERTKQINRGNPLDEDVQVGAQASAQQYNKILDYLEIGQKEGAQVLSGGNKHTVEGFEKGFYIEPTLLKGDNNMRVFQEEIFGPVLVAVPFDDIEDALSKANDSQMGLAATVWTSDIAKSLTMINRLQAGIIYVNSPVRSDPNLPLGGYKQSGMGRELGKTGVYTYTTLKSVNMVY
jgi:aldehyde dehydrogenase